MVLGHPLDRRFCSPSVAGTDVYPALNRQYDHTPLIEGAAHGRQGMRILEVRTRDVASLKHFPR